MAAHARIEITPSEYVTAVAYPAAARTRAGIAVLLAHGAGGNQLSPFMVEFASGLAERGIDAVTFNFVYSEQKRRLPDRNDKLEACYRAVIAAARSGALEPSLARSALAIGGKSMGGRIASQVAAVDAEGIAGLVLLGYPLHPPGRPDQLRTKHLPAISVPMLIVQGERDAFGTPDELGPVLRGLKAKPQLYVVDAGDHSFKVPKSAGTPQAQVHARVLDEVERWLRATVAGKRGS
ncbi:MAG TPA: alpha/beta family hydrolase [Stellaceae bacterium]|nr:alpha/beta family hydrolase [Stellaceae bacterium]